MRRDPTVDAALSPDAAGATIPCADRLEPFAQATAGRPHFPPPSHHPMPVVHETVDIPSSPVRLASAGLALLAWSALLLQLLLSIRLALANGHGIGQGLLVYTGFFTILSNLLVALVLTAWAGARRRARSGWLRRPGTAAVAAAGIAVVAVAYHLLLRQVWDPRGWQLLADQLLHYLVPAGYLLWWWLVPGRQRLRWRQWPAWLAWPVAYLAYVLVRGELTGLYPYPFIEVPRLGYAIAVANAGAILAGYALVAAALLQLTRWRTRPDGDRPD